MTIEWRQVMISDESDESDDMAGCTNDYSDAPDAPLKPRACIIRSKGFQRCIGLKLRGA